MKIQRESPGTLQLWAGVECTVNRVGSDYRDQLELTGHAHRLDDLERIRSLGITRLRYPVLWERVAPQGLTSADWTWTDERLGDLRRLGIAPIAGLVHHGSGPRYCTLLDPRFPDGLAAYAGAVARRYPWIDAYTPVNEPLTTARFCGLYGLWYPHAREDRAFVRALLNQCRGTVLAMRAIRVVNPRAELVQTDDAGKTFSTESLAYQADFENHRRWLGWDLLCGRLGSDHPLWTYLRESGASEDELGWFRDNPCPPDVVGLNYYLTSDRFLDPRLHRYPPRFAGGNGRDVYADVDAVRACRSISGHQAVLEEAWDRYRRPVAITEAHLGCTREEQMRWLVEAWEAAHAARRAGADVRAVTAWALFGLSDWDSLLTRSAGSYEPGAFDVRGPQPRRTAVAQVVKDLAAGGAPTHPVLSSSGWWRRPTRLWVTTTSPTHPPQFPPAEARRRRRPRPGVQRPIVITGSNGTLGSAFVRVCDSRGLFRHMLSRQELDITDPHSVDGVLRRLNPWAVINAAGYVRVDDAESDVDRCRRENTIGPRLLAEACSGRDVRLVTFSSDLVFDGSLSRPYVESDAPAPVSVYGRSKADAETAVRLASSDALIVRTSAFFGPWDRWNAVYVALEAIAKTGRWQASSGQRVSPTYVPDLVQAVLDLLIDGAQGIWHLANAGDVTWADLIRMAARATGADGLIEDCDPLNQPQRAQRPTYSVLGTERGQLLPSLDDALQRFAEDRIANAHGTHRDDRGAAA
jgi:dTDP-4-dehydrorhamnose reductase